MTEPRLPHPANHDAVPDPPARGQYERLFELTADMCGVAGFDGFFRVVNPAWTRVLGWSEEEMLAEPFWSFFHPDDLARSLGEVQRLADTGEATAEYECRLRHRDGRWVWVNGSASPDLDAGLFYVVVKDIADRKAAEDDARFRSAFTDLIARMSTRFLALGDDALDDAIAAALGDIGELLRLGRCSLFLTDGTTVDCEVEWCAEGVAPARAQRLELSVAEFPWWAERLEAEGLVAISDVDELPADATDSRRHFAVAGIAAVAVVPLVTAGPFAGFVSFEIVEQGRTDPWNPTTRNLLQLVADLISSAYERRRANRAVAAANEQLGERNRELERSNRELESFAYVASHDLRSPVQMAQGSIDLLADLVADSLGEEPRAVLDAAQRNIDRSLALIGDLLTFAQVSAEHPALTEVALGSVVDEAWEHVAATHPEATLQRGELPVVCGNEGRLVQLFENLLRNAAKFQPPGQAARVVVDAAPAGDRWRVEVRDNGIGIAADQRDAVVQMFTRLHRHSDYPGTGIGLAICHRIVEQHGGTLEIGDAPEGGAAVTLTFEADVTRR